MFKKSIMFILLFAGMVGAQPSFYEVNLNDMEANEFIVKANLPELSEADSIYNFVAYAPGAHQALNFGRFVKSFNAYDTDGKPVQLERKSTNEWKLFNPGNIANIEYVIDDSYDKEAEGTIILPMSGTSFEKDFITINTFGVIGYFENHKSDPVELNLIYNYDWISGCALPSTDGHLFKAESFYQLYDSPILLGNLSKATRQIGDIKVDVYTYSSLDEINSEKIMDMAEPILNSAYKFITFAPVDRYVFLMTLLPREEMAEFMGGGALEHSYSSLYTLPAIPQFLPALPGVMAHEFMHILTPLHLRSEIIANFDYTKPTTTDKHLWLYEGVTEWVAQIMQLRGGVIDLNQFGNIMSQKITTSQALENDWSLVKLSKDWSSPDAGNRYIDIYHGGALTAACLDIELLKLTNGEKGLREAYLGMIEKYGKEHPFDNDTFIDDFVNSTHPKIKDFFDKYILDNQPLDYQYYFGLVGYNYYPVRVSKDSTAIFGLHLGQYGGQITVNGFSDNHKQFGLEEGDVIESIFGIDANPNNLQKINEEKAKHKPGDKYDIVVKRGDETITLSGELVVRTEQNVLEVSDNLTNEQKELRDAWMVNLPIDD